MASSTLLALPQEIRDIIYRLILAPTGHITLTTPEWDFSKSRIHIQPYTSSIDIGSLYDPSQNITFPLLLTCQQIHAEAKDVIWTHNALHITLSLFQSRAGPEYARLYSQPAPPPLSPSPRDEQAVATLLMSWTAKVQSIHIHYRPNWDHIPELEKTLAFLVCCERLKRFALTVDGTDLARRWRPGRFVRALMPILDIRAGVERRLVLKNVAYAHPAPRLSGEEGEAAIAGVFADMDRFSDTLRILHVVFGGELWVSGTLIMRGASRLGWEEERRCFSGTSCAIMGGGELRSRVFWMR